MYKIVVIGLASFLVVAIATMSAHAASLTYDFVDYIDNPATGGSAKNGSGGEKAILGDFSIFDTSNTKSLTITAHGTNYNNVEGTFSAFPYAYFDHGNAGMGVCQDHYDDTLQCKIASDDNVTGFDSDHTEILSLAFAEDLKIDSLLFRNDGHTPEFGSGKSILMAVSNGMGTLNIGDFSSYEFDDVTDGSLIGAALLDLSSFTLNTGDFVHMMYDDQQFYLSGMEVSAVPLPPSAILFGTALLGLAGLRRRKRKAA